MFGWQKAQFTKPNLKARAWPFLFLVISHGPSSPCSLRGRIIGMALAEQEAAAGGQVLGCSRKKRENSVYSTGKK
jgi:hypothetical protein